MRIDDVVDTAELYKLVGMLEAAGIPHEAFDEPQMGGATIKLPDYPTWKKTWKGVSVIQHRGSYGGWNGKLEVWITPGMEEPQGWLTAEEAFDMIAAWRNK